MYQNYRVLKNCYHKITRLRKIFENMQTNLNNECKTENTGTYFMYLSQVYKVYLASHVFVMLFSKHVSGQNFQSEHIDSNKGKKTKKKNF